MDRLETRELAYFLAAADELHFGRAAAGLGIAQPALSRAIQQLERRLGVTLFDRTSRAVVLTEAGRVLAQESRAVLDGLAAATERTQRAGAPGRHLVLAMKPGGDAGLLPSILAAYAKERDVLPIDVQFGDQVRLLREGAADAALLYVPPDRIDGLDAQTLITERALAVLPAGHPLGGRNTIRMDDLAGEQLHSYDPSHAAISSISELMHVIALGHKIAVLPESLTTPLRADLVTVPVSDVRPSTLRLAWPATSTSSSVAALVRVATQAAERL